MRNGVRILVYVLIGVFFIGAFFSLSKRDTTREMGTLTRAVEQDVTAYYAQNGYYPDSIAQLQEAYGLSYDKNLYYIGYTLRGANIRPDIQVVELGKES